MQKDNKAPVGKQSVLCDVMSCRHNSDGHYCILGSINVAPCANGSTGKPQDESMCASYEVQ